MIGASSTIFSRNIVTSCALLLAGYSLSFLLPDIPYQLRMFLIAKFTQRQRNLNEIPQDTHTAIVNPTDIDGNIHMNNARYFRELNFARRQYFFRIGLWELASKYSLNFIVRAQSIRYRKELKLWDKYTIIHNIAGWNNKEKCFYVEAKFVKDSFVMAIQFCKYVVVSSAPSGEHIPTISQLLVEAGLVVGSIESTSSTSSIRGTTGTVELLDSKIPPAWVAWEESNSISSKELRPLSK